MVVFGGFGFDLPGCAGCGGPDVWVEGGGECGVG